MTQRVAADEVRHVASLARIALDDDEVDQFAAQFADIIEYCQTLDDVPTIDDEPVLVNVMRSDEVQEGLSHEDALRNAAATEDGYFKGPRVS